MTAQLIRCNAHSNLLGLNRFSHPSCDHHSKHWWNVMTVKSWSGKAFLLITSFFTRLVSHSLEFSVSTARGRDRRKMPVQTVSITQSPGRLHLPLGLESPAPTGHVADTAAIWLQGINSNWYTSRGITLWSNGKEKLGRAVGRGLSTSSDTSDVTLLCTVIVQINTIYLFILHLL